MICSHSWTYANRIPGLAMLPAGFKSCVHGCGAALDPLGNVWSVQQTDIHVYDTYTGQVDRYVRHHRP